MRSPRGGYGRGSARFTVAFVVVAVVVPAAITVAVDGSLPGLVRGCAVAIGVGAVAAFGGYTRQRARAAGRHRRREPSP